jgi:hypothetical protein
MDPKSLSADFRDFLKAPVIERWDSTSVDVVMEVPANEEHACRYGRKGYMKGIVRPSWSQDSGGEVCPTQKLTSA